MSVNKWKNSTAAARGDLPKSKTLFLYVIALRHFPLGYHLQPCSFPLTDTILPLRRVTVRALAGVVTRCVLAFRARVTLVYVVKAFIYREQIQTVDKYRLQ